MFCSLGEVKITPNYNIKYLEILAEGFVVVNRSTSEIRFVKLEEGGSWPRRSNSMAAARSSCLAFFLNHLAC